MKVLLQTSHGLASISLKAKEYLNKLKGYDATINGEFDWSKDNIFPTVDRFDKDLVKTFEDLQEEAFGPNSTYKVVEVNEPFKINNYDGIESIVTLSELSKDLIYPEET